MKRSLRPLTFLPPLVFVASLAQAHSRPSYDAYYGEGGSGARASARPAASERAAAALRRQAVVTSVDERRGVPSFLSVVKGAPDAYALGATSAQAARAHLERFAPLYGMTRADAAAARVAHVHDTGRGAIVVTMRQQVGDVEVFRSEVKLLLDRDKTLLAIAGAPVAAASQAAALSKRGVSFRLGQDRALAEAFGDLFGYSVAPGAFRDAGRSKGTYRYFDVAPAALGMPGVAMRSALRVKTIYFPLPDRLVPAYYLELDVENGAEGEAYGYVISAVDGTVLYRADLVSDATFNYKVYAENDPARHYPPTDSPFVDASPHPGDGPGAPPEGFVEQIVVPMEGFNTPPGATPGGPAGPPDPWLPDGATVTQGNNVKAYADHDEIPLPSGAPGPLDGQSGSDPTAEVTAATATFDYAFDPAAAPDASPQQIKASITQLFYVNNWLHDYWYDSGFDEAAGVAQNSNFGRVKDEAGQVVTEGEGDALEAQAQDKFRIDARNNANMFTPLDGAKPRMQMFAWTAGEVSKSVTTSVPGLNITQIVTASFGAKDFTISGPLTYVNDGVVGVPVPPSTVAGTVNDGCEPLPAGSLAGRIALIDRGFCLFPVKVLNAQKAGAVGALIVNSAAPAPASMGGTPTDYITIGAALISQADGAAIKAALAGGAVTATLAREANTEIDGTQDNGIVAHEWGHYWHHRLVNCVLQQCRGMSEGWGDFAAMHLMVRENDDLSRAYATAYYATSGLDDAPTYFGIRRYPRSTSRDINPLSFRHIADKSALPPTAEVPANPDLVVPNADPTQPPTQVLRNSQQHNAGEIWSVTLFDAYAALLTRHPYDEAKRRMADYLVGGMKLTVVEPTFTQQRDAILAYTYASDPSADKGDFNAFAKAFADRGMGVGAVSPPVSGGEQAVPADPQLPQTFNETVESTDLKGNLQLVSLDLDDSVRSCDGDGIVDAEETGRLTIRVANVGMAALAPSDVTVAFSPAEGVEVQNGGAAKTVALDPYGTLAATFDVKLAADAAPQAVRTINVTVANAGSFTTSVAGSLVRKTNADEPPGTSALDTVDSVATPWAAANAVDGELPVWGREQDAGSINQRWHGADLPFRSDGTLESPEIVVGDGDFSLKFDHAYSFETSPAVAGGPNVFWDGGVIEYQVAGGAWVDVATVAGVVTGYGGAIFDNPDTNPEDDPPKANPLEGRPGFIGKSAGFPALAPAELDFGKAFAGQTVRFRFRIGSDAFEGAPGWFVDNIAVVGATNNPFPGSTDDQADCANAPTANAGADQTVRPGDVVTLDASGSTDPNNDPLTYGWTQLEGPTATLADGGGSAKPTFTAPAVTAVTTLTFNVRVSDGKGVGNDQVTITVDPNAGTGGSGGAAGAGGSGTGGSGTAGSGTGGKAGSGNAGRAGSIGFPGGGDDDDGCGCSTVGSQGPARAAWLPAIAAGLAVLRRRRRSRLTTTAGCWGAPGGARRRDLTAVVRGVAPGETGASFRTESVVTQPGGRAPYSAVVVIY